MTVLYVVSAVFILTIIYGIIAYNRFIKQENLCDEAFSGVQVQLKRRYDLIPNVVSCVKGYAAHEKNTLEEIVAQRNSAMNAVGVAEKSTAENALSRTLKTVFALAENYPDLKANQNFIQLQETLAHIEDDLQNARRYYNATARTLNTMVKSFPSNLIASRFGFTPREFFQANETEQQNIQVAF